MNRLFSSQNEGIIKANGLNHQTYVVLYETKINIFCSQYALTEIMKLYGLVKLKGLAKSIKHETWCALSGLSPIMLLVYLCTFLSCTMCLLSHLIRSMHVRMKTKLRMTVDRRRCLHVPVQVYGVLSVPFNHINTQTRKDKIAYIRSRRFHVPEVYGLRCTFFCLV